MWLRRYLPCEVGGTTCEMGGAAIAYVITESFAAAAVVATIGASVGYYSAAYVAAVRTAFRAHVAEARMTRAVAANGQLAHPTTGLLLRADPVRGHGRGLGLRQTVFSYERFNGLLVVRRRAEEVPGEPAASVAAA